MEVFLFPLVNVSLFPKTTKPLNIFEARYLEMVRTAIAQKHPIALAFIEDAANVKAVQTGSPVPYVRAVAGYGHAQIIEERENGTILIFLTGLGKVRLGNVVASDTPYMVVEAEVQTETVEVREENKVALHHLLMILSRWIQLHIPDLEQQTIFMKSLTGPQEIVGAFSSYLVRDFDLQQTVLEIDDINEKIHFLHRLAESGELTV